MMIDKIIKTVKFCKEMGISYVEFGTNTDIKITQGESLLLNEFSRSNNCEILLQEIGIQDYGRGMIFPKYQLQIYIEEE